MRGTWTQQDKKLPGAYINVVGEAPITITQGERGIVALALDSAWGSQFEVIDISANDNTLSTLGFDFREIPSLNEIMKNAHKAKVIITSSGTKAKYGDTGIVFTAKKEGTLGNSISMVIEKTSLEASTFNIHTYLGTKLVDRQIISKYEDFKNNDFVIIGGDLSTVIVPATIKLSGGTTVPVTAEDFNKVLDMFSTMYFNVFVNASLTHETAREPIIAMIKKLADEEGIRVQAVLPSTESTGADYEGILEVANGVVLDTGVILDKTKAIYWVAGITAGANINESNTGKVYQGAIDVSPRLTRTQLEEHTDKGHIVFKADNNQRVTLVYDINSLITYLPDKKESMRKNRVMRVINSTVNDVGTIWEYSYMGKINNNQDGRNLFKGALIDYFKNLQNLNAIENFSPEDLTVEAGAQSDAVVVTVGIEVTDSGEKLYMTVNV